MSSDFKIRKEEPVGQWLKRLPSPQSAILTELRALVRANAPHLEEAVKWSAPWYVGNQNVIYLACHKNYAVFGVCNGAHLDNADGLIEGIGKDMRHIKVPSFENTPKHKLLAVLESAVAYDESLV